MLINNTYYTLTIDYYYYHYHYYCYHYYYHYYYNYLTRSILRDETRMARL